MRVVLFFLPFLMSPYLHAQIANPKAMESTVLQQPPEYLGYLDLNGILPLNFAPSPNDAAIEAKYWFSKTPLLKNSFGLSWQLGFNEGYAKSDFDFTVDDQTGKELAYLYNYLSARYKVMTGKKKIRPYAEVGGGWLFTNHDLVERTPNPNYDPDHTCPENAEFIRDAISIRTQHRLALDVEAGLNFQFSEDISLNVGVGSIVANKIAHLEKAYQPALLESNFATPTAYQFSTSFLQSASLKVGLSIRLLDRPQEEEQCCCGGASNSVFISDTIQSSSCNK